MTNSLTESWYGIVDWLKAQCPDLAQELLVTPWEQDTDWTIIEDELGISVPVDFKLFYQLHNGQSKGRFGGIFFGMRLLDFDQLVDTWDEWRGLGIFNEAFEDEMYSSPPGHIKPLYCNSNWLPFTSDGFGNHIAIDLDPDHLGTFGQVIIYGHEEHEKKLIAPDISTFLSIFLNQLSQFGVYYTHNQAICYEDDTSIHYHDRFSQIYNTAAS